MKRFDDPGATSECSRLASEQVDAIIIGAGHNGLAAAAFLARNRVRVLVLEKNDYVGGMAGSREILTR